jgi:hypothetical protein
MGRSYTTPAETVANYVRITRVDYTRSAADVFPVRSKSKKPPDEGGFEEPKPRGGAYLSWVETVPKVTLRLEPTAFAPATMTIEMPAAIRPYSIAVAPHPSGRQ